MILYEAPLARRSRRSARGDETGTLRWFSASSAARTLYRSSFVFCPNSCRLVLGRILTSCRLAAQRLVGDLVQRATWRRADDRVVDVDPVWAGRVVVNPAVLHAPALAGWRLPAWPLPTKLHLGGCSWQFKRGLME